MLKIFMLLSLSIISCGRSSESSQAQATESSHNFYVTASDPYLARQVAEAAENYFRTIALKYTGEEAPLLDSRVPINVISGNYPAQGVTSYNPDPIRDFQMEVTGTPQRILDSVLPHEVTHIILAKFFGRPLPRWADEGIATTVEVESVQSDYKSMLLNYLSSNRGIPMNTLFLTTEYPADVLPFYAQGYSVASFLAAQKPNGYPTLLKFIKSYFVDNSWTKNLREIYGFEDFTDLQESWLTWVSKGMEPENIIPRQPLGTQNAIDDQKEMILEGPTNGRT